MKTYSVISPAGVTIKINVPSAREVQAVTYHGNTKIIITNTSTKANNRYSLAVFALDPNKIFIKQEDRDILYSEDVETYIHKFAREFIIESGIVALMK